MATLPGPPSHPSLLPTGGPHPVAHEGAPGALTLIKGYKSNLSSARNVASLSKACWAQCEPTIIAALDSGFHTPASSRWQQATLSAGRHRAHSRAPGAKALSPEPEAGGASGHQGFRVAPATSVDEGSSHNPPPEKGGGNHMFFKVEKKESDTYSCQGSKPSKSNLWGWKPESGGTTRVLGCLVMVCFSTEPWIPRRVCFMKNSWTPHLTFVHFSVNVLNFCQKLI